MFKIVNVENVVFILIMFVVSCKIISCILMEKEIVICMLYEHNKKYSHRYSLGKMKFICYLIAITHYDNTPM